MHSPRPPNSLAVDNKMNVEKLGMLYRWGKALHIMTLDKAYSYPAQSITQWVNPKFPNKK